MPAGADIGTFLLSDGKLTEKPSIIPSNFPDRHATACADSLLRNGLSRKAWPIVPPYRIPESRKKTRGDCDVILNVMTT